MFNFYSVLEQFSIVKFPINLDIFYSNIFFSYLKGLFYSYIIYDNVKIIKILKKFFSFIQSFFLPNFFSTKNYVYARIMVFSIKCYFRLFSKKKLSLFWRTNFQVLKVKIQLKFQELVKTNFGDHYPFYTRLLNFYPYFLVIFFSILFHNFNGLLFYGLLIQHFCYKILFYLFNLL